MVNYDVWGTPEQWQDLSGSAYAAQGFKMPKSGVTSYYNAYNSGALEIPAFPTDRSLAFWGIGKGSIINHPMYLSPYWDGETLKTDARAVNATIEEAPAIFDYAVTPNYTPSFTWHIRYNPNAAGESNISMINLFAAAPFSRTLISYFNYQKILIVPYVRICYTTPDSSSWHFTSVSLKSYIDNRSSTYSLYGKIVGIGYRAALGDGLNSNRDTGHKELGVKYPISFGGSSATYQASSSSTLYKWFATQYGFDSLTASNVISDVQYITPYYEYASENYASLHTIGDADTGFRYKYCKNYYAGGNVYGQVPIYYYDPESNFWKVNDIWNENYTSWAHPFPYIECTAENKEDVKNYVLSQIAFLGLPFVYDEALAPRGQIGDTGVYLPVFDENGVTTGEYEEGRAALRLPNSDWTDGRTGSGYDPDRKPSEEDFGDLTNRTPTRVMPGGLNFYVTNYTTIYNLQRFLNGQYTPSSADLTADFKGTNPGDYIVAVQKYPVVLPNSGNDEDIMIGKISSTFSAPRLSEAPYIDFGTISISPYFSSSIDFRDYQSKILLLMPFIGTAELDPRTFIGHTLGLIYNIDYLTGSVAAEIKRDGLTIETKTAKLAQTVPFFAGNMGTYQNELAQTSFAIEQSKIKQITGAVTTMLSIGGAAATAAGGGSELAGLGSGAGIIRGASNMLLERINQESLEYKLEHTQPQIGTISTASAGNAFLMDDRARVLIFRPYMLPGYDPATYSHVVGNATLRAAALYEFSGLTVAAAAELKDIYTIDGTKNASEQELKLIKQALLAGVYV